MQKRIAIVVGAVLLTAACGGAAASDPAGQVDEAAAPTDRADSDAGAENITVEPADPDGAVVDYVRCMRAEGVDIPDPDFGSDGGFAFFYSGDDRPGMPAFDVANATCEHHLPGAGIDEEPPDPEEMAETEQRMLEYARCLRAQGLEVPDPEVAGGAVSFSFRMGDLSAEEVDAAQRTCSEEVGLDMLSRSGA